TFDVLTKENGTIRIRMNGIDCPEKKQDYYQVAKDALGSFIFKKEVHLVTFGNDRYKRTIANVFINGENINLLMIKNGYAWHYKKYSSDLAFANAENEARDAKRGLWKMKDPVAPWDFRHR
ncbi:MAG: thermonuclease family protein, partial [Bacteroidota bacterium]